MIVVRSGLNEIPHVGRRTPVGAMSAPKGLIAMKNTSGTPATSKDLASRPLSALIWWGVPTVVGISAGFGFLSLRAAALVWMVAFAWMGTGCLLNARRCHRRHCYIAGPILLAGAIVAGLRGFGIVSFGPGGFNYLIWSTAALVLLSFVPELIGSRYLGDSRERPR